MALEGHPGVLVRKEKLRLEGISDDGPTSPKTLEYVKSGKDIFDEMRDKYGVTLPEFQYVVSEDPDGQSTRLFTMTEEVRGRELSDIPEFTMEEAQEVDRVFSGAIRQLADSYRMKNRYWIDIDISQFMLGKRMNEEKDSVYMVDVEPRSTTWYGNAGEPMSQVFKILAGIELVESRSGGTRLDNSRAALRDIFSQIEKPTEEKPGNYMGEVLLPHYKDISSRLA